MAVHYFKYLWYADRDARRMRRKGFVVSVPYEVKTLGKDIHWAVSITRE